MEVIERALKFLSSYPMWAKALALGGVVVTVATLLFAPRNASETQANATSTQIGAVLKILGVRLFPNDSDAVVRVTAFVNGTSFRYPSLAGVDWLQVGPSMSPQTFELPKADRYAVKFEMQLKTAFANAPIEMVSQREVSITQLPHTEEYNLHKKEGQPGLMTRSASVGAAVRYALERAP
jgi:hypothetical protein